MYPPVLKGYVRDKVRTVLPYKLCICNARDRSVGDSRIVTGDKSFENLVYQNSVGDFLVAGVRLRGSIVVCVAVICRELIVSVIVHHIAVRAMVGKWVVCSQVPVRLSFLCQDVLEYITGFRETWLLRQ